MGEMLVKAYRPLAIRKISSGDLMYCMVTTVIHIIYLKLAESRS